MIIAKTDALKAARLESGLNLTELAKLAEVKVNTTVRIERGGSTSPSTAKRIAEVLGKPVTELFSIT